MKIRKGFVSNSSSSSFMCDVCGYENGGMDVCLEDVGMFECKMEHTVCENCGIDFSSTDDNRYSAPAEMCPCCQLKNLSTSDELVYLKTKLGVTSSSILDEIRDTLKTYEAFQRWLSDNKVKKWYENT